MLRYSFIALLSLTMFSSCKKDDNDDLYGNASAEVNLINASPDAASAQLYVADVLRTPTAISYGQESGYNKTYAGDQNVVIKSANGQALSSSQTQLDAMGKYSFFLVGQNNKLDMITVTDDQTAPASGKAKIRFVNASPNSTSVTLAVGNTVIASNQDFRSVSSSTEITAGVYTLTLTNATNNTTTVVTTPNTTWESGKIYTVYAKGLVGNTSTIMFGAGILSK